MVTKSGAVQGKPSGSTCAYEGIAYAEAPTGALRWKAPVARAAWTMPRPSVFCNWCPQPGGYTQEDCLCLNVWTPSPLPKSSAPVMVFVHGGGFVQGSGSQPLYDGTNLATATGNLVVTRRISMP